MLAFLFSWIIIFFVLFSFGDFLIYVFNRLCRCCEKYNLFEVLLLGMCSLTIPLSIWSLFFPSNHFFLIVSVIVSIIYWCFRKEHLLDIIHDNSAKIRQLSWLQLILIGFFSILSLCCWVWMDLVYDALFYHHQAIRWNEEYAAVPGLGNLEDRFAFNSNYMLLSAIFTFRFIFGQAIYSFQNFFILLFAWWLFYELFKSKYEVKRVICLFSFALFYAISVKFMQNTSTDLLPNLILFYLIAKYVFYPDFLKGNNLINIVLPVFLLTLKLSLGVVLLIPLFVLIVLIKRKDYRIIVFLLSLSLTIMLPWLIRNVILSGYLIFPVYQIDLFSFDWKVPQWVVAMEDMCVKAMGDIYLDLVRNYSRVRDPLWMISLIRFIYVFSVVCIALFLYNAFRRKIDKKTYMLFFVLLLSLILWFYKGPDIRFVPGVFCAMIMLGLSSFFMQKGHRKINLKTIGFMLVLSIQFILFVWTARLMYYQYQYMVVESQSRTKYSYSDILYKPCSYFLRMDADGEDMGNYYHSHFLNNDILIYISDKCYTFDQYPCVTEMDCNWKFSDYRRIEARGNTLGDGFRTK